MGGASPLFECAVMEATMGIAPMYNGFADRRVSYFATWPFTYYYRQSIIFQLPPHFPGRGQFQSKYEAMA